MTAIIANFFVCICFFITLILCVSCIAQFGLTLVWRNGNFSSGLLNIFPQKCPKIKHICRVFSFGINFATMEGESNRGPDLPVAEKSNRRRLKKIYE